jgi:hypothetical protein
LPTVIVAGENEKFAIVTASPPAPAVDAEGWAEAAEGLAAGDAEAARDGLATAGGALLAAAGGAVGAVDGAVDGDAAAPLHAPTAIAADARSARIGRDGASGWSAGTVVSPRLHGWLRERDTSTRAGRIGGLSSGVVGGTGG